MYLHCPQNILSIIVSNGRSQCIQMIIYLNVSYNCMIVLPDGKYQQNLIIHNFALNPFANLGDYKWMLSMIKLKIHWLDFMEIAQLKSVEYVWLYEWRGKRCSNNE